MTASDLSTMRELDSRTGDGLHVRLLWNAADDRLAVSVADWKAGEHYAFDVVDGERALHAFRHPFTYVTAAA
jgi:hypothetical protein